MQISNFADLSPEEIAVLERELTRRENLLQVLTWNNQVVDSIAQDEFTHDLVIRWRDFYLVFDSTWVGGVTAVAVWKHQPTANEILQKRFENGWRPTASSLLEGDKVLGHAACLSNLGEK